MTIIERRCPRCAIRRTVSLGEWGAYCWNCRHQWDIPLRPGNIDRTERTSAFPFEPAELVRLERYRVAICKGIYTDWPAATPAP